MNALVVAGTKLELLGSVYENGEEKAEFKCKTCDYIYTSLVFLSCCLGLTV